MIVKNEEANLERCLISVKGVVDEIIVVDTGSTDHTVEIAAAHGARIYHHPWQNDFSLARNYSLGYASGEWILYLDADEELEIASRQRLRPTLDATDADALYICVRNYNPPQSLSDYFDSWQVRLFRNRPQYRFEQIVHNQIEASIRRAWGKICRSDLMIWHYGYMMKTVQGGVDRDERNLKMLEEAVLNDPQNAYLTAKLGAVYHNLGNYAAAFATLSRVFSELDSLSLGIDTLKEALISLAAASLELKHYDLAIRSAQSCYEIAGEDTEALLLAMDYLARAYAMLGESLLHQGEQAMNGGEADAGGLKCLQEGHTALQQAQKWLTELGRHPNLRPSVRGEIDFNLRVCQVMLDKVEKRLKED